MIVGYTRVSNSVQNISAQVDLLKEIGCEKIHHDIASGVSDDREGLTELISIN